MRDNKKDSAVRELVSKNYSKYYKLAYSYVKNDQDAMDILQESVYKAILKSAQIRDLQYDFCSSDSIFQTKVAIFAVFQFCHF